MGSKQWQREATADWDGLEQLGEHDFEAKHRVPARVRSISGDKDGLY